MYNSFAQPSDSFYASNSYDYQPQNETFPSNEATIPAPGDQIYASRNDTDSRKIFVGGLSWETTEDDLRQYFLQFGEIVDVNLKVNPATNTSRGFGFVLFKDQASVDRTVDHPYHILHGRTIDPKRAMAEGSRELSCKVFVGGLDPNMSKEEIIAVFSQYGKVEQIELPYDKVKNERRGFGFITFESEEVVDNICSNYKVTCGKRKVDVKRVHGKDQRASDAANNTRGRGSKFPPFRAPAPQGRGRGYSGNAGYSDPNILQTNGMFRSGCPDDDDYSELQGTFDMIAAVASELNFQSWDNGGRGDYGAPRFQGAGGFRNSRPGNNRGRGGAPRPHSNRGRGDSFRGGFRGRGGNFTGNNAAGFHPYSR